MSEQRKSVRDLAALAMQPPTPSSRDLASGWRALERIALMRCDRDFDDPVRELEILSLSARSPRETLFAARTAAPVALSRNEATDGEGWFGPRTWRPAVNPT